ncbi:MAG: VanZ family protein [Candidatus Accumulibacter sp.]|uniref:VanZ family protein n=1 Tax=Accumulibacter sp. TaxID=2053492 RepID=UPI0025ED234E|nr:VanZ family protein [Accumulibacter sp.]MCP5247667.1 VanZ family protein [Accumulibacter sp.]
MEQAQPTLPVPADDPSAPPLPSRPTLLPLYLALAYVVLIGYASLYPFANWRDLGIAPLEFLYAAWPRYWTGFDLAVNVVAYLPLGFLLALTLRRRLGRWSAALAALLLGSLLSAALECLQNWLPARVPSNLDLACNAAGTAIGAVIAVWSGQAILRRMARLQQQLLAPIPHAEPGLVLLGMWLLTQLSPETLLFGVGDLRQVLGLTPALPYAAPAFVMLETGVIVCNTVVIGLFARTLLTDRTYPHLILIAFFVLALAIRTLAAAVLVAPQEALVWLTPGARLGLWIGAVLLSLLLLLPAAIRIALAGVALMAGTALVNLTPPNPYSEAALATWRQGHFLNFNGLTRWIASLWPFLALPYLTALGRRL